jgi:hypothetical protein
MLAPEPHAEGKRKVAIACQGGHAAFEVGVLSEILEDIQRNRSASS